MGAMAKEKRDKELYRELRRRGPGELWEREVAAFDGASAEERLRNVAVVRAVGVVVSEKGSAEEREKARAWLRRLLRDPAEKIRRYAVNALPKLAADASDESELLALLKRAGSDSEKKYILEALEKIGGEQTLAAVPSARLEQKVKARESGAIRMDAALAGWKGIEALLHCRAGLEGIVAEEAAGLKNFRVTATRKGLVILAARGAFALRELYALRCFGFLGIALPKGEDVVSAICSRAAREILETFTEGPIRYRLEFLRMGHQRAAVRELAERIYAKCPQLINSPSQPQWTFAISERAVELRPRLAPDPRFAYRQMDVPAASHPPLAACMARLAGRREKEIVWDPFCGSGLELIERALLGGVAEVFGTDRSAEAVAIAEKNFRSALGDSIKANFVACDFREAPKFSPTLIITNPPMGKRVPIPDLRGLIEDLFKVAAERLRAGGRLVFVNPLAMDFVAGGLRRQFRQKIDMGGFHCRLEKYVKE
jgi:23S rRNA G2445 N2-methylase RlmL